MEIPVSFETDPQISGVGRPFWDDWMARKAVPQATVIDLSVVTGSISGEASYDL
jgi:hypothetical protein